MRRELAFKRMLKFGAWVVVGFLAFKMMFHPTLGDGADADGFAFAAPAGDDDSDIGGILDAVAPQGDSEESEARTSCGWRVSVR